MSSEIQLQLLNKTYGHYVGQGYYSSDEAFISEAEKYGISRRTPANIAKGMNFKDRIVFLRYGGRESKTVFAFCEGRISDIVLEKEIADKIGTKLAEQGRATYNGDIAGQVERGCGSFSVIGGWTVSNVSLTEIMAEAMKLAEESGEKLFVMVGAKLTKVYDTPTMLVPPPPFTRTFLHLPDETYNFEDGEQEETRIIGIGNYRKN